MTGDERPLEEISAEVQRLARIVDVPPEWLPTFETSRGDGHPVVEFDRLGFHYASVERDHEFFRRLLFTEDDLLYVVFRDLTFQMAYSSPEAASRSGSEPMKWISARQRELLARLNPTWARR
jgi:hypothetical protein